MKAAGTAGTSTVRFFAKACSMLVTGHDAQSLKFPDIVRTLPRPGVYLSRVTYDGDHKGTVQLRERRKF